MELMSAHGVIWAVDRKFPVFGQGIFTYVYKLRNLKGEQQWMDKTNLENQTI